MFETYQKRCPIWGVTVGDALTTNLGWAWKRKQHMSLFGSREYVKPQVQEGLNDNEGISFPIG